MKIKELLSGPAPVGPVAGLPGAPEPGLHHRLRFPECRKVGLRDRRHGPERLTERLERLSPLRRELSCPHCPVRQLTPHAAVGEKRPDLAVGILHRERAVVDPVLSDEGLLFEIAQKNERSLSVLPLLLQGKRLQIERLRRPGGEELPLRLLGALPGADGAQCLGEIREGEPLIPVGELLELPERLSGVRKRGRNRGESVPELFGGGKGLLLHSEPAERMLQGISRDAEDLLKGAHLTRERGDIVPGH